MVDISAIQAALGQSDFDAWLFADHHGRDEIASMILGPEVAAGATRRWFYLVPREGEPKKLVHRIERGKLSKLPGGQAEYSRWEEQRAGVLDLCRGHKRIAMQYSPEGMQLLLSIADAGVVELVRSSGAEVVSSAETVQRLFSLFTGEQAAMHRQAGRLIDQILKEAFELIRSEAGRIREAQVKYFLIERFAEEGLVTDHGPVVAARQHTADPHYEPEAGSDFLIEPGEVVLIDLWAKLKKTDAPFYDVTWVACCGEPRNPQIREVFSVVRDARDAAVVAVQQAVSGRRKICGYEIDGVARAVITQAGFGQQFIHRTGHSIGTSVHGMGVNIDGFESRDERPILSGSCFSIEPGIYLEEFGIRSELNVLVESTSASVTGARQDELLIL